MQRKDWISRVFLPSWTEDRSPDREHPHRRRFTDGYRRKRGIVKNVWIASGVVMAVQGSLAIVMAIALGTTFLSFVILDETG
ncbi:MAG: hypothetical protein H6955_01735 [Chromatiaceae bacterium]|nr:hypothetical protein [Chromatiaceae bacterium]